MSVMEGRGKGQGEKPKHREGEALAQGGVIHQKKKIFFGLWSPSKKCVVHIYIVCTSKRAKKWLQNA